MVGDSQNCFCINNDFPESDKVRNKLPNLDFAVVNWKSGLLNEMNILMPEFNHQRILVNFLMIAMPNGIQHRKRTTNDPLCLQKMNLFSSICVYPVHLRLKILN